MALADDRRDAEGCAGTPQIVKQGTANLHVSVCKGEDGEKVEDEGEDGDCA